MREQTSHTHRMQNSRLSLAVSRTSKPPSFFERTTFAKIDVRPLRPPGFVPLEDVLRSVSVLTAGFRKASCSCAAIDPWRPCRPPPRMTFLMDPCVPHNRLMRIPKRKTEKKEVLVYVTKYGFEKESSAKMVCPRCVREILTLLGRTYSH